MAVDAVAGGKPGPGNRAAADVAGQPADVRVAEDDVEIARAFVDQLELKRVQFVGMLLVISNILPGDGEGAVGIVFVVPDHAAAARPGVNVTPKGRDDRVGPVRDD